MGLYILAAKIILLVDTYFTLTIQIPVLNSETIRAEKQQNERFREIIICWNYWFSDFNAVHCWCWFCSWVFESCVCWWCFWRFVGGCILQLSQPEDRDSMYFQNAGKTAQSHVHGAKPQEKHRHQNTGILTCSFASMMKLRSVHTWFLCFN
jgi:hypothetical protein